jgi:hypothetical protein
MLTIAPVAYRRTKDNFRLLFQGATTESIGAAVHQMFTGQGYVLESRTQQGNLYGRGSKAGRLLAGGLSGRQEFRASVRAGGDKVLLTMANAASALTGGAIGVAKGRKELERLIAILTAGTPASPDASTLPPQALGPFTHEMLAGDKNRGLQYALVVVIVIVFAIIGAILGFMAVAR